MIKKTTTKTKQNKKKKKKKDFLKEFNTGILCLKTLRLKKVLTSA
jgi:hypothetical protein